MNDLKDNWMREVEEVVPDDESSLEDDLEHGDIESDQIDDCPTQDHSSLSPVDCNAFNHAGAGFSVSPMLADFSASFPGEYTNFPDPLALHSAGVINISDGSYDGAQAYMPQQMLAYGQM